MVVRLSVSLAGILAAILALRLDQGVLLPLTIACVIAVSSGEITLGITLVTILAWGLDGSALLPRTPIGGSALVAVAGMCVCVSYAYFRGILVRGNIPGILSGAWMNKHSSTLRIVYRTLAVAFAFALLFRGLPVTELLGGFYLTVLLSLSFPRDPARRLSLGTMAPNLILVLISVSFTYGIAELAVWRFTPVVKGALGLVADPKTYTALAPSISMTCYTNRENGPPRPFVITSSSLGLRDKEWGPKAPGEFRILIIGDSFAMGWGLDFPDTISQQLQRMLASDRLPVPVSVINGGIGGYAPWQERVLLRDKGIPLHPDLVVLQIFPDNDVQDSLPINEYLEAYNPVDERHRRVYRYCELYPYRLEADLRQYSYVYRLIMRETANRPFLAEMLLNMRIFPSNLIPPPLPQSAPRSCQLEPSIKRMYPTLEKAFRHMGFDILGIRNDCEQMGAGFLAFALPDEVAIDDQKWNGATRPGPGKVDYIRFGDVARTEDFMTRHSIPFVRVVEPLRAGQQRTSMYLRGDGHLSREGAKVIAQTLERGILERYFPLSAPTESKSGVSRQQN